LVCLELLGFALTKVAPDLFDQRQPFFQSLQADDLERFKQSVASNTLGWDNPAGETRRIRNCVGEEITFTYSADRIRLHSSACWLCRSPIWASATLGPSRRCSNSRA
jgi:hypothetical protein